MDPDWARDLRDQAKAADVAVWVKQLEIDGRVTHEPTDWPEDLRIQKFPEVRNG